MADPIENVDTPPAPTPEPAAPAAAASPPLTMEVVQRMIEDAAKKAYDSGAAAARRAEKGKPPKAATAADPATTQAAPTGDDAEFGEALTDELGEFTFDRDQRREIRAAARRERPEDVGAFVQRWARMFGKSPGQAQPAASATNQPAGTASSAPAQPKPVQPSAPAPAPPVPDRDGGPVFRAMTEDLAQDTWQAYVRRKGAVPGNPYDPRNRAALRELRRQFEAEAGITRIHLGARRG